MNILILEPPYSHLFYSLVKELKPTKVYAHIFNLGYLVYLPFIKKNLVQTEISKIVPSEETKNKVQFIKSLANSNIAHPTSEQLKTMAAYYEYLRTFIEEHKITHILCHNDLRWQHAIAKQVAKEKNICIFFSEEGLFRPNTMTFDPKGVNANSSVPRERQFFLKNSFHSSESFKQLDPSNFKRAFRLIFFGVFLILSKLGDLIKINTQVKNKNYSIIQYLKLLYKKAMTSSAPAISINLDKKFIFVPLQVSTDTQTIIHSRFKGTQEVIYLIEKAYAELPPEIHQKVDLVFKQHPMEAHTRYQFSSSSIVTCLSTGKLLEKCDLVLLVNSTTIVEALEKNKKIITLGESLYDIEGLTLKSDEQELSLNIQRMLETISVDNKSLINSFLNYLKYHYQINGNIFYYDKMTLTQMRKRIICE